MKQLWWDDSGRRVEVHLRHCDPAEAVYLFDVTYQQAQKAIRDGEAGAAGDLLDLMAQWKEVVAKGGGQLVAILDPTQPQMVNLRPLTTEALARLDGQPFHCLEADCPCRAYRRYQAGALSLRLRAVRRLH